jgi:hypothetical protein
MFFRFFIGSLVSGLLILLGYYFIGGFLLENKLTEEQLEALKMNPKTSEYQIYKSPRLPSVHSLTDDCENLASNLLNTVDENNYCQIDSECEIIPFYGYPLGTYNIVNSKKFENSINAIESFESEKNKWECVYPMYDLHSLSEYKTICEQQKCRYEKIQPTLPKLPTRSTFENKPINLLSQLPD